MRLLFHSILTGILLFASATCIGQEIFFNRVSPPEGKLFEHITGMVQDRQGYMWLASKKGLYRYDGYQMTYFRNNPLDPNSISTDQLESITIDANGILWIGTQGSGLERFDPATGVFTHFRHNPRDPSSISDDLVTAVLVDREGTLWVGGNGLDRYDARTGKFIHYKYKPDDTTSISSDEVVAIYEDSKGELWIGTGSVYSPQRDNPAIGGLNLMDKRSGRFTRYLHDPKKPHSLVNNKVRAIYEDSKGNFWVGTAGDGLHIMDRSSGQFQHYPYDPRHPEKLSRPPFKKAPFFDHITFIREDTTGGIWIGTAESGLNYYNTETRRITHYEMNKDTAGSFNDRTTWWAYESREGVIWISTLFGNLYRINPLRGKLPFYPTPGTAVNTMYEDRSGMLWIGTENQGLILKNQAGETIKKYIHDPLNPGSIGGNTVQSITEDSKGNLIVALFGGGLNFLNRQTGIFTRYLHDPKNSSSLSHNITLSIYEMDGDLWIGTFRGLNRMDRKKGTFRHYLFFPEDTTKENFGPNIVTSVLKDRQGKWWAGSWWRSGLHQFNPEDGTFKSYLKGASVIGIFEDAEGKIWAGASEGIFQYNRANDSFQPLADPIYLTESKLIRTIVQDDSGNIWTSTTDGIVKVNYKRNETTVCGKNYGINGNDLVYGAAYKGRNGKIYIGKMNGYYAFFPNDLNRGIKPPEIVISDFRLANKLVQPGSDGPLNEPLSSVNEIRLHHNQDIFSFDFAAIDYTNPEENRHLFMLEGYDEGWNVAGTERRAIYFNVPPGKYVFRVKVANSYGIWKERAIAIIIVPPWWNTWWFRIAAVLVIAAIFYSIIRWRMNQKFQRQLERSEKEKQLAELRQRTGELEMQALRAQMNPHFIFNSLNSINRFILLNNKAQASEYLTKFSRLVRMILQNSQASLITLESELDALKLYLDLETLRFDNRFTYKITVPKDLDIEVLKVPPLIIQPYVENAIWHGLMHKEEKGHLDIEIRQDNEHLLFFITDDGIGRKQSAAMTSKSATRHKSMGLKITADRISMLEKSSSPDPTITINDLVHPDSSAAGTQVIIKIPVIYD